MPPKKKRSEEAGTVTTRSGCFDYPDGTTYEGEYTEADEVLTISGRGVYVCDRFTFSGLWNNNVMHGEGTLTFETGARYEGEFQDGHYHGHGAFYWPDGSRYVGMFELDEPKDGLFTDKNGHVFEGKGMSLLIQRL